MKRSKKFLLIRLTFILFAIHIVTCKLITLLIHLNNIVYSGLCNFHRSLYVELNTRAPDMDVTK